MNKIPNVLIDQDMILYYYKCDGLEEITTAQQYFFQYFDTPPTLATRTIKTRSGGNGVLNVHHDTFQKYVFKTKKTNIDELNYNPFSTQIRIFSFERNPSLY